MTSTTPRGGRGRAPERTVEEQVNDMEAETGEQHVAVTFTLNSVTQMVVLPSRTLASDAIRHHLRQTGTHVGCEHGVCGACTVLLDGKPVRSCLVLAASLEGRSVTTVEGSSNPTARCIPCSRHSSTATDCNADSAHRVSSPPSPPISKRIPLPPERRRPTRSRAISAAAPDTRTSRPRCSVPRRSRGNAPGDHRSAPTTNQRVPRSTARSAVPPARWVERRDEHDHHRSHDGHSLERAPRGVDSVGESGKSFGQPIPRSEDRRLLSGQGRYLDDLGQARSSRRSSGRRTPTPASSASISTPHSMCRVCTRSTRTTISWTTPRRWRRICRC